MNWRSKHKHSKSQEMMRRVLRKSRSWNVCTKGSWLNSVFLLIDALKKAASRNVCRKASEARWEEITAETDLSRQLPKQNQVKLTITTTYLRVPIVDHTIHISPTHCPLIGLPTMVHGPWMMEWVTHDSSHGHSCQHRLIFKFQYNRARALPHECSGLGDGQLLPSLQCLPSRRVSSLESRL